jgi:hypothetical protein
MIAANPRMTDSRTIISIYLLKITKRLVFVPSKNRKLLTATTTLQLFQKTS